MYPPNQFGQGQPAQPQAPQPVPQPQFAQPQYIQQPQYVQQPQYAQPPVQSQFVQPQFSQGPYPQVPAQQPQPQWGQQPQFPQQATPGVQPQDAGTLDISRVVAQVMPPLSSPQAQTNQAVSISPAQLQQYQDAQRVAEQAQQAAREREFQQLIAQNKFNDVFDRMKASEKQAAEQARQEAEARLAQVTQAHQTQQHAFKQSVLASELSRHLMGVPFVNKDAGEQAAYILATQLEVRESNGQYVVVRKQDGLPVEQAVQQAFQSPGFAHYLKAQTQPGAGTGQATYAAPFTPEAIGQGLLARTVQAYTGGNGNGYANGFGLKPIPSRQ